LKKKHEKKNKSVEEEEETYTANLYITKWLTTVHLVCISTNNAFYIHTHISQFSTHHPSTQATSTQEYPDYVCGHVNILLIQIIL